MTPRIRIPLLATVALAALMLPSCAGEPRQAAPAPISAASAAAATTLVAPLATWSLESPFTPVNTIRDSLRHLPAAERPAAEAALLAVVAAPATKPEARMEALRLLPLVITPAAIPALEQLAAGNDAGLAGLALQGLADLHEAEAALERLATTGPEPRRPSAFAALAAQGTPSAVAILIRKADIPAAADALASTGDPAAARACIDRATGDAAASHRALACLLRALAHDRASATALAIPFATKHLTDQDATVRAGAMQVRHTADATAAAGAAKPMLSDPAPLVRRAAAHALPPAQATGLGALPPDLPPLLVERAHREADPAWLPMLREARTTLPPSLQPAVLLAMGVCADEAAVGQLIDALGDPAVSADAAKGLAVSPHPTCGARLCRALASEGTAAAHPAVLAVLAQRQERQALDQARACTASPDKKIRQAAFAFIADTIRPGDLPQIIPLASAVIAAADRKEWTRALMSAAGTHPSAAEAVKLLQPLLATDDTRPAGIAALTLVPGPDAAAVLAGLLNSPDLEVRKGLIRDLSQARTDSALTLLTQAAAKAQDPAEGVLAVRGAIDTIKGLELKPQNAIAAYRTLWPSVARAEEREAIIAAVTAMRSRYVPQADQFLEEIKAAPAAATKDGKK
jgi:HEAT repeat protein